MTEAHDEESEGPVARQMPKLKAYCVLLAGTSHLVWRGHDATSHPTAFHRLLGGHVEYGEYTRATVVREMAEEVGLDLDGDSLTLLSVVENIFVYNGDLGHEVVFVYLARLAPPLPVPAEGGFLNDDGIDIWCEWRPIIDEGMIPLYPEGLSEALRQFVSAEPPA